MARKRTATPGKPDRVTKKWTRNPSDELAVKNGCRFDEARGRHAVDWIEAYCRLYEGGEYAGKPMVLCDWQLECTMRLFGWVRWSDKWQREIRRFREASIWVAKKNKKSPTAAAWALYLFCGDGEMGQKVFLGAKDGQQVRKNLARHVHEMLLQSPELQAECEEPNKTTMQLTHRSTRSTIEILSSSNSRTQESKEGLNGSIVIDETHVVDQGFMSRITRAGISRSEPMRIEVSTAGNNPDGYGHERFVYASEVEQGKREDQELFAAIYAAPQDLSDADLEADPLKWGRMANPAMGHTVDPEEYLSDYQKSKGNLSKLAEFKMYRLNVWQQAASPWLKGSDWELCRREFTEAGLAGQECWAGLDLSKTRDMSALVLVFKGDGPEEYKVLPYFWLPEETAKTLNKFCPTLTWAAGGHLELTPGAVLDYGFIKSRFRRLAKLFRIKKLAYDRKYAEELTQALEQGVMGAGGAVIEEGTGVERWDFPQTLDCIAGPTAEWERAVIAHKMHHNGNPILAWQVGHVKVRVDAGNNKRPVKPSPDDYRKIDGIVSGIMALACALLEPAANAGGGVEFW